MFDVKVTADWSSHAPITISVVGRYRKCDCPSNFIISLRRVEQALPKIPFKDTWPICKPHIISNSAEEPIKQFIATSPASFRLQGKALEISAVLCLLGVWIMAGGACSLIRIFSYLSNSLMGLVQKTSEEVNYNWQYELQR